jgi:hypothetical protein
LHLSVIGDPYKAEGLSEGISVRNRLRLSQTVSAVWWAGLLLGACGVSGAQPLISGKIGSITGFNPQLTLNLVLTNGGSSPAASIDLNAITFKVLTGTGSVAFTPTAPVFPLAIAGLGAGASETVPVNVTLTGVVQRFSITESGTLTDGSNDTFSFSIGQTVIPPVRYQDVELEYGHAYLSAAKRQYDVRRAIGDDFQHRDRASESEPDRITHGRLRY